PHTGSVPVPSQIGNHRMRHNPVLASERLFPCPCPWTHSDSTFTLLNLKTLHFDPMNGVRRRLTAGNRMAVDPQCRADRLRGVDDAIRSLEGENAKGSRAPELVPADPRGHVRFRPPCGERPSSPCQ